MTLIMSVSGVRGLVGQTMTPTLAAEMGAAFGSHLGGGTVVVGRDSRASGGMLNGCLVGGLLAAGVNVVDLGVVSTPGVAVMIAEYSAAGGVVITASHNPAPWNGIKFLTAQGFAPPPDEAEKILARYREKRFTLAGADRVGQSTLDDSTHERHIAKVFEVLAVEKIKARRVKAVLDSVNGAGCVGGRMLLERLGCEIVQINGEPNGLFAHTPEPTAANLTGLCDAVKTHGADIGFAQDPDADRLAVVDDNGRYIGEEYTVALAAKHRLAQQTGAIAVNLSTSRMVDDLAAQAGGGAVIHRTRVGEANVAAAVIKERCILGGEGNGGVIDPRVVCVRDSFVGMGLILNLLADERKPLSEIVDAMPSYVMIKEKFEIDRARIDAWLHRAAAELDGTPNDADGLRIDWPEGWVHLRPSNTEPIARVIAEAADDATAQALIRRVTDLL